MRFLLTLLLLVTSSALADNIEGYKPHLEHLQQYGKAIAMQDHDSRSDVGLSTTKRSSRPSHTVFGYHPYWVDYNNGKYEPIWPDYDYGLLTHLAWFGLEIDSGGNIIDYHGWPVSGIVEKAHDNGVKLILTVILFDDDDIETLLASASNRQNAINELISVVSQSGADGVNIDFESVRTPAKDNFNIFIHDLTQAFHDQLPGSEVSIAMPSVDWGEESYDYNYLASVSDGLMIMAYGYYWSGSTKAGPISPLNAGLSSRYITWTIEDYLAKTNQDPSKLILGLPWYGRDWQVTSNQMNADVVANTKGTSIVYHKAEPKAHIHGKQYNSTVHSAWFNYSSNNIDHQVWYDDSLSLAKKYEYAKSKNLKGIGIWALGYDGGRMEIWGGLADAFQTTTSALSSPSQEFFISPGYPNPFNDSFALQINSPEESEIIIKLFDIMGREIYRGRTGVNQGGNVIHTDAEKVNLTGSGIYFIQISLFGEKHIQRLMYVK